MSEGYDNSNKSSKDESVNMSELILFCETCQAKTRFSTCRINYASQENFFFSVCPVCDFTMLLKVPRKHVMEKDTSCYLVKSSVEVIYPAVLIGEPPSSYMPEDIRDLYDEARSIAQKSPRGASALLRLALQLLCEHLAPGARDINGQIAQMVRDGLSRELQEACDVIRHAGNECVHKKILSINIEDNSELAVCLFSLLNRIVEQLIAIPQKTKQMYELIPQSVRSAISKRDKKSENDPS